MSLTKRSTMPFLDGQPFLVSLDGAPAGVTSIVAQATATWSDASTSTISWDVQAFTQDPETNILTVVLNAAAPRPVEPLIGGGALVWVTGVLELCVAESSNPAACIDEGIGIELVTDLQLCPISNAIPITTVTDPSAPVLS